jgi:PhnB protein
MTGPAPDGYDTLTPRIVVSDVLAAVEFLRTVFDATGDVVEGRPAEVRIGDSLLMVTGAGARDLFPAFLYVYVDDADGTYERAVAAGATIVEPPLDTPYGDRRAMVRDPFGNVFQIAHRARADPVDEVLAAVAAGTPDQARLALHPYLHWTDAAGVTTRGRNQVLTLLSHRAGGIEGPAAVELRDGQVYRWREPAQRPVRAVVFDFGGVLITPITTGITALAERNETHPRVMLEVLIGPDETGDHPWHRAERGELAVAEIQAALMTYAASAGVELAGDEIEVLMVPTYSINDEVMDRIRSLRAEGIRTGLLTNTFAEFRPTLERDIDLGLFDAVIESYAVGARKPEQGIYEAMSQALGVDHTEIVFLDDFAQNLVPARELGWRAIHVTDVATALDELDRLLVTPRSSAAP